MKPLAPLLIAAALFAGGNVHAAEPAEPDDPPAAGLPALELTPKILYRHLLAEIAGQRGQMGAAAELYLDLARETRDPRIVRRAAEIALHSRRLDIAAPAAKLWSEVEPASNQAKQTYIGILAAQGQYAELQLLVADLLAAEPELIGPNLLHLNRLFARGGDRQAIRAVIDNLTAPYLQRPEAHYARALAAADAQEMAAARGEVGRALELKPDWEAAALLRSQLTPDRAEALMLLGNFVAANPGARDARLALARALVSDKRYQEARREFSILLDQGARDPARNGDVVFAVAVLSLQLGDTAEAEKHLRQLVDIGHGEIDKARYYLGQIAEDRKGWDEALQWFSQVGHGDHYLPARLHAANVLARQGKLDEARATLVATQTDKPRERAQLLTGEAQLLREAGRHADAHAVLAAGLEAIPDQPELLYETALLAEKLGRIDELESRLRRLLKLQPDNAHALNALGYSLADRNIRLPEARSLIEQALALAPNDPFILDSKGWLLFRLGDLPAALDVLSTAFGIRPDPEIAAHLGEVLWTLGRQSEARDTWDKARRDHPGNEALAETIKRLAP